MARPNLVSTLDKLLYVIGESSSSDISFTSLSGLTSIDVRAALDELKSQVDNAATIVQLDLSISHAQRPVTEIVSTLAGYIPSTANGTRLLILDAASLGHANFAPLTGTHQNQIIEKEVSGYVVKFSPIASDEGSETYNQEVGGVTLLTDKQGKYHYDGTTWVFDASLVDNVTVAKNGADEIFVKALGITSTELAVNSVVPSKLDVSVFGELLAANGVTGAIDFKYDISTFENIGNVLFLKAAAIKTSHIDFGPGAGQFDASNLPIASIAGISATDVQGALAELEASKLDLSGGTMTGDIFLSGDATLAFHPVTKNQLDALEALVNANASGQIAKQAVDLVSLFNVDIVIGGTPTIDGVVTTNTMTALLTNQTNGTENGAYEINTGAWVLRADSDGLPNAEVFAGTTYLIQAGISEGGKKYTQINKGTGVFDSIIVGTDIQSYAVTQAQIPLASVTDHGLMSSTDKVKIDTMEPNSKDDQIAVEVVYSGTLAAINVKAGLDELNAGKVDRLGDTMTGNLNLPIGAKTGNQAVSVNDVNGLIGGTGLVAKVDYNAFTILAADVNNTPLSMIVSPSTFVGRKSVGGIVAMSAIEARAELNVFDGAQPTNSTTVENAGSVMKAHYGVNQVLTSTTASNPLPVTIAQSTVLGRRNGNIQAIALADLSNDLGAIPGRELFIVSALDVANGYITLPKFATISTVGVKELGGSDQVSKDEIGLSSTGIVTPDFEHGVFGHTDKVFFINGSWITGSVIVSGLSDSIILGDKLRISWLGKA